VTCFIRCSTLQPQPMLAHSQLGGWGVVTLASDPRLPVLPWQSSPVVAVSPLSVVRAWPGPSSFPVQVASQFIHLHPAVESRRVFRLIKVSPSASRFAPSFPGFPSHGSRPFLSFNKATHSLFRPFPLSVASFDRRNRYPVAACSCVTALPFSQLLKFASLLLRL